MVELMPLDGQPSDRRDVSVSLLGGFRLNVPDREILLPLVAQRLICFLVITNCPRLRQYVAGSLWTDYPEQRARANLRSVVWRVNQAVPLIDAKVNSLSLRPGVVVDYWRAIKIAEEDHKGHLDLARTDINLLKRDLVPDWPDEWLCQERERFTILRARALEIASETAIHLGRSHEAVLASLAAVTADPFSESAHSSLVKAHVSTGNMGRAIIAHRKYEDMLAKELGLTPSADFRALCPKRESSRRKPKLSVV